MKPRPNPGGPPSKPKYSVVTDSRPEIVRPQAVGASFGTRPLAFCIMSPRVNPTGKANRKGSRSESESEQGVVVGRIGPEARASYPWTA